MVKMFFEPRKEIETDVFSLVLQAWDKEKILHLHEKLNPTPLHFDGLLLGQRHSLMN